jgi:hypothetical protein
LASVTAIPNITIINVPEKWNPLAICGKKNAMIPITNLNKSPKIKPVKIAPIKEIPKFLAILFHRIEEVSFTASPLCSSFIKITP